MSIKNEKIKRDYYIAPKSLFPEQHEGQVLYAEDENALYIDTESGRNLINPPEIWVKCKKPDPWVEIIANQNYATDYQLGKLVDLDFGEYGVHPMELVAMDTDDKADGSGKARMTWISKDIICNHIMNEPFDETSSWENSDLRQWLREDMINNLPKLVVDNIVNVNKTYVYSNESTKETCTCVDNIWIPSARELNHTYSYMLESGNLEDTGCSYDELFPVIENGQITDSSSHIKQYNGQNSAWWTRTKFSYYYYEITSGGSTGSDYENNVEHGVVIGFCL